MLRTEIRGALSSPRSVLALALPTGKEEVDNARESKQSSEKTINIRWRFPKSQQDLSVTESLPDWWWEEVKPLFMKEYWPDSACAQGVDMGLFETRSCIYC